jgi:integrase
MPTPAMTARLIRTIQRQHRFHRQAPFAQRPFDQCALPKAGHLLAVLRTGTVSTNAFLRKVHNFALDMNWLPAIVIPRGQWPAIHYKEKRAITPEEHQKIIAAEVNPERKTLYLLCWHLGANQGDIASLKGEDVDWTNGTVSFLGRMI